jgi:hypothetical protein
MREVRRMVVPCSDAPIKLEGNVKVSTLCNEPGSGTSRVTVTEIVSEVGWVWDENFRTYLSRGTYEYTRTVTSTGTKTCVFKETAKGSIDNEGSLALFTDPDYIKFTGYDYLAGGDVETEMAWTESCQGTSGTGPVTITWLPDIRGISGGSSISGEKVEPVCIGLESSGTETTKFNFALPAPPK